MASDEEDDLFAAFSAATPVDASSHYPPPPPGSSRLNTPDMFSQPPTRHFTPQPTNPAPIPEPQTLEEDDDDPFGLGQFEKKRQTAIAQAVANDDDDILGMLGKPVSELPRPKQADQRRPPRNDKDDEFVASANADPRDAAIAELVDMGFTADKARDALEATDFDVQSAVGLILNQAHEEAKSRQQTRQNTGAQRVEQRRQSDRNEERGRDTLAQNAIPSWMRAGNAQSRQSSSSRTSPERDMTQYAAEIGSSLFKSANSLLKAGRKQVQKTLAEFQEPQNTGGQPRWMQQGSDDVPARHETQSRPQRQHVGATDEAMMLESGRSTPALRADRGGFPEPHRERFPPDIQRRGSPLINEARPAPRERQIQQPQPQQPRTAERLNRRLLEEESANAYVSSARRRKPQSAAPEPATPEPAVRAPIVQSKPAEPELDIFSEVQAVPAPVRQQGPARQTQTAPLPVRPKASTRSIPTVSPSVLSASAASRTKGTEAFKRGDYGEAHTQYTNALSGLPQTHPITIVILCNRALTSIKNGDPKSAVADADATLKIIGPSRGDDETIDLGSGESEKPMKEFFGKALMRKAEAYENMEKWGDAAAVWQEAVAAGIGGSVALQGRNRCEKAAGGGSGPSTNGRATPAATSAPAVRKPTLPAQAPKRATPNASSMLAEQDSEAVKRLRAANAAAAAASDEAFALNDAIEARLNSWKSGKEGNLRALLASLDTILWSEAGWKKVGMGDLVMPNKVKIIYMKAIAKVHPDKVS